MSIQNIYKLIENKKRGQVLKFYADKFKKNKQLNYLEIGTAFSLNEGLSTLLISSMIHEYFDSGLVVSIDINIDNINSSLEIVRQYNPEAVKYITHYEGKFIDFYSSNLSSYQQFFDLVFLDGSGDAMENLIEFYFMLNLLKEDGIIIIDDSRFMQKTEYKANRDFGKASLVYPLLLISNNLAYFKNRYTSYKNLPFITEFYSSESFNELINKFNSYKYLRVESLLIIFKNKYKNEYLNGLDPDSDHMNLKINDILFKNES